MIPVRTNAKIMRERLEAFRGHPHVLDIRQRGVMVGIELTENVDKAKPFNFAARTGAAICHAMRAKGLIVRPLGDVIVLMPARHARRRAQPDAGHRDRDAQGMAVRLNRLHT